MPRYDGTSSSGGAKLGVSGFGAAMLGALWGYNGWAVIAALGGEIKTPGLTIPRALIGGTLTVIALYLLVNTAYFYVLTPVEVASVAESSSVAGEAASRFFGPGAAVLVLRRTMPDMERPYRVWGYPVVPILFLLVTAFLLVNTLIATPSRALAGIVLIIAGLPVYEYFRRRAGEVTPPLWQRDD